MPLSDEQKKQLAELQRLEKEPQRVGGDVRFNLDLSDNAAVELARELGILPKKEQPPEPEPQEGTPDQGGYFGRRGNAA